MSNTVTISFASHSLGDNISWVPYCEEYKRKHNLEKVFVVTQFNHLFQPIYPELTFIPRKTKVQGKHIAINGRHLMEASNFWADTPKDIPYVNQLSVQGIAASCLGLDLNLDLKPRIAIPDEPRRLQSKYVCIAIQSTTQAKYWNRKNGWEQVIKYLKRKKYKVICLDKYKIFGHKPKWNVMPKGAINKTGDIPLEDRIIDLKYADFFIGLTSGLTWLAHAVNTPIIQIVGVSTPDYQFNTNGIGFNHIGNNIWKCNDSENNKNIQVIYNDDDNVCRNCHASHILNPKDWFWCPENKNFECTNSIKPESIFRAIDNIIKEKNV
jgi:autotransporter strand-loop-strand O-heptosyltransferase|tara:strand:+ start:26832 stop:27800 length:969 start_codon:yes stop_codon:yes gene_type:complete